MAGKRNKVLIPISDRLNKAKTALRDHEELVSALRCAYDERGSQSDTEVLNEIGRILDGK